MAVRKKSKKKKTVEKRKLALLTLMYNPNDDTLEVSTNGMWGSIVELYGQVLKFLAGDGLISLVQQERQVGASLLQQQLQQKESEEE